MTPPARILVVEDDPDQRAALVEILRREGYDTVGAGSAESALDALQAESFDLVVADHDLGAGATGSWLARTAATGIRRTSPVTLLVTGHDQIDDRDGLKVLLKPLDVPHFVSEVDRALRLQPPALPDPPYRIALTLYISQSLPARRTLRKLRALLNAYNTSQIALTVVDVSAQPAEQTEEHRVVVTPTLLKSFPIPSVWIAGEFGDPAVVAALLDQAGVEKRP